MEKVMSCNTLDGRYQFRIFFQMHYLFVLMGIFVLIINPYLTANPQPTIVCSIRSPFSESF